MVKRRSELALPHGMGWRSGIGQRQVLRRRSLRGWRGETCGVAAQEEKVVELVDRSTCTLVQMITAVQIARRSKIRALDSRPPGYPSIAFRRRRGLSAVVC
jgi:hypothetical protein